MRRAGRRLTGLGTRRLTSAHAPAPVLNRAPHRRVGRGGHSALREPHLPVHDLRRVPENNPHHAEARIVTHATARPDAAQERGPAPLCPIARMAHLDYGLLFNRIVARISFCGSDLAFPMPCDDGFVPFDTGGDAHDSVRRRAHDDVLPHHSRMSRLHEP